MIVYLEREGVEGLIEADLPVVPRSGQLLSIDWPGYDIGTAGDWVVVGSPRFIVHDYKAVGSAAFAGSAVVRIRRGA